MVQACPHADACAKSVPFLSTTRLSIQWYNHDTCTSFQYTSAHSYQPNLKASHTLRATNQTPHTLTLKYKAYQ